jgi:zinc ribbon protein
MYCPRCATPNIDNAKFCRACGTDLETVALSLAGRSAGDVSNAKSKKESDRPFKKRVAGTRHVTQGALLLATSSLICLGFGLFVDQKDWFLIWSIFFGWMACWGTFTLALGISDILESRMTSREIARDSQSPTTALLPADDPLLIPSPLSPPISVTEHTTQSLGNQPARSKQTN